MPITDDPLIRAYLDNELMYSIVTFDVSDVSEDVFQEVSGRKMNKLANNLLQIINSETETNADENYAIFAIIGAFHKLPGETRINYYHADVYFKPDNIRNYLALEKKLQERGHKVEFSRVGTLRCDRRL